ncbi:SAF domain-containing protein [Mycolicibacterium sp. A43C]
MGESLDPTVLTRVRAALRPDWTRTVAARRTAAAILVLLAAIIALRPDPAGERVDVVIAAADLAPGSPLAAGDLTVESRLTATVPDGAQTDIGDVVGAHLTAPARRGEVLTDVRLLGTRLTEATAGPDARVVPIPLSDAAVVELIRPGDVLDVLAAPDSGSSPELIATRAVVAMVSTESDGPSAGTQRVVMVVLPRQAATAVAGATLTGHLTVTFH